MCTANRLDATFICDPIDTILKILILQTNNKSSQVQVGNNMASNRLQVIIGINYGLVYERLYPSLGYKSNGIEF